MELSKLTAAFFLRFDAEVDTSVTVDDMEMLDVFSASPAGGRLPVHLAEHNRLSTFETIREA